MGKHSNINSNSKETGAQSIEGALTSTEQFVERHQKVLLIGLLVVVLVVLGVLGYRHFISQPREEAAQVQIYPAQQQFQLDSFAVALNGDGNNLGFLQIIEEFSGTQTSNLARYYAGICYRELGEWGKALDMLQSYKRSDKMVAPIALGAMGDCHVELGNMREALGYYEQAASYTENTLTTPIFLLKQGMLQEQKGDWSGAAASYEKVAKEYPRSSQARTAEKLWARALTRVQ